MWLLIIYLCTVLFSLFSMLGCLSGVKKELKFIFKKEEIKEFKNKSSSNTFTTCFLIICPIINILNCYVCIFKYEEVKDGVISKINKFLNT